MPVASVNGLKNACSSAAVQLPPHVLTMIVRVCAIVRSVTIRGPAAAAATALRKVRRLMTVLLLRAAIITNVPSTLRQPLRPRFQIVAQPPQRLGGLADIGCAA